MASWLGSLRVRITVLATVAVAAALVVASVVLVWAVERTGVGQVRDAARGEVDRVAEALMAGEPLTRPDEATFGGSSVLVLVQDETGEVLDTVPSGGSGSRLHQIPGLQGLADVGTTSRGDVEHLSDEAHDRREDRVVDTRIHHAGGDLVVASRSVDGPDGTRTVVAVSPLAEVAQSVDAVIRALTISAPLLLLFVAATTWLAVDRSLRPVEQIRRQADAISHSTLSDRLPEPTSARELHQLTATLNEMLGRLEAGARRQQEFIADASHELRTPLAAMRAELEVALAHADTAEWQPVARRLLADQRRLEQLTTDLLTLARLEDAGIRLDAEPVDLAPIVAVELDALTTVELETDMRPVQVQGSAADLARLVRNLVDNAARYADRRIAVVLCDEAGHAVLRVDDDGPGVPEADRERVFERFTRLDGSRTRAGGGVGIGLALVRRVAEAHGGSVTIGDAPLGGARFEVRIPTG
ncbi:MAG TPA: ATP-binding protein [Nitriliruptorales bacterium]